MLATSQHIEIREATPHDAADILALLKTVAAETDNLTYGAGDSFQSAEEEAAWLERVTDDPHQAFFVALVDGELAGSVDVRPAGTRSRLAHRGELGISVAQRFWGRGAGTRLMEQAIDFAHGAGMEILSLEVRSDNERAIRLYRKFGFRSIGRFDGFLKIDGTRVACDIMWLDLLK